MMMSGFKASFRRTLVKRLKNSSIIVLPFFFLIALMPIIYMFSYVFFNFGEVYQWVFNDPISGDARWVFMQKSILLSFEVATLVTIVDIIIGLPMAWILSRYDFWGKKAVDTLVDLPLAVPTSALGFSVFLFWGSRGGLASLFGIETGLFSRGPMMIVLAHIAFTYPYVVRSLTAIIEEVNIGYEYAARTLGASSVTAVRTITLPLIKPGLITGAILAFTRSLGETGATILVCGIYETAPLVIVAWRQLLEIPPAAFLGMIVVAVAVFLLYVATYLAERWRFPLRKVWPKAERFLSGKKPRSVRDLLSTLIFFLLVLIPSAFTLVYMGTWWSGSPFTRSQEAGVVYQVFLAPDRKWLSLWMSILTSLEISTVVTCINLAFGIPMALLVVRGKSRRLRGFLEALLNIPIAIPSAALGFSAYLLWGAKGLGVLSPGFWLVVLVHTAATYPYMVKQVASVLEGLPPMYEEAARTLGAKPFSVFRMVTLPLIMPGILAGTILSFTRSLGETGATIVVMGTIRTVPVIVVNWVEAMALPAAAFASVVLIATSYVLMLLFRHLIDIVVTKPKF